MAFKGDKHVITCAAIVLWDGITKPETKDNGNISHNLRLAIPNHAPELAELRMLSNNALRESKWKGVMPAGGNDPLMEADVEKFGPMLAGHTAFSCNTQRGIPPILDLNGAELSAMQFGRCFYPGAKVAVYVHAYDYDNKQKGIAFGLDGIQIIDSSAPALPIGGGVSASKVIEAFAAGAGAGVAPGRVMLNGANYDALKAAGWSDAQMIEHKHMAAPVAAPPAPPAAAPPPPGPAAAPPPPAAAAAPPPPTAVAPHPGILNGPPTPVMLNGANYDALKAAGWSDAQMIEHKHMAAPAPTPLAPGGSAPPPPPPAPAAPAPGGKRMRSEAGTTTYEQYIAAGWTDAALVQNGFMDA